MAYFSNSTEGAILDEQCMNCKHEDNQCPIATVHLLYNYDQVKLEKQGIPELRAVLDELIPEETNKCYFFESKPEENEQCLTQKKQKNLK